MPDLKIDFSKLTLEQIQNLAREAQAKAAEVIEKGKTEGCAKIKQTMSDYGLTQYDLLAAGIITLGNRPAKREVDTETAHYNINGQFWTPGIGKIPQFVLDYLKKGGNLAAAINGSNITPAQANEQEVKTRGSKSFLQS